MRADLNVQRNSAHAQPAATWCGVVQNWSTLQCSKQNTEQCGYDHAPVTRGRMRAQFPLPHGPSLGLAVITWVPTHMTSHSIQQHTAPHTTGYRHHTACPNQPDTQGITQAAKQPNLPSNQHTIQQTRQATLSHDTPLHHTTPHHMTLCCSLLWCVICFGL